MKCHYHPDREAVGTCGNCGRAICVECTIIEGGRWYCPRCYELEAESEYGSEVVKCPGCGAMANLREGGFCPDCGTILPGPSGNAPTVKISRSRAWKTIVAAALMLLAALCWGISRQFYIGLGIPVIPGVAVMVGFPTACAIDTFLEKSFKVAMFGAICATFSMPLFGILAGILVWQSRSRFA